MRLFAVKTYVGNECFSLDGRMLVHDDREELEFLIPGHETVEVTGTTLPTLRWADHPDIKGTISFPLNRNDFR